MQKLAAVFSLLMLGCAPVLGGQPPADKYVACVVGNAAVNLHNGMSLDGAEVAAGDLCAPLMKALDEEEAEGVSDFVHSVIADLSESSAIQ